VKKEASYFKVRIWKLRDLRIECEKRVTFPFIWGEIILDIYC
jgi:hypothetical protein